MKLVDRVFLRIDRYSDTQQTYGLVLFIIAFWTAVVLTTRACWGWL